MTDPALSRRRRSWRATVERLTKAYATRPLSADPPEIAVAAVDAWLREVRRRSWCAGARRGDLFDALGGATAALSAAS